MADANQLILVGFVAAALGGCATAPTPRDPVPVADARSAGETIAAQAPTPKSPAPVPASRHDADLLFQAIAAVGSDYRSGGRDHETGFDCSGLVAFVFRQAYGLELPHNSRAQSAFGEAVEARDLQPGDLVFFNTQREPYSHVGIYLGEDKFIHAPRTGSPVRTENMRARYWATRFDGGRRIAPAVVPVDYAPAPRKPVVTYP